jgi:hypothetical protein
MSLAPEGLFQMYRPVGTITPWTNSVTVVLDNWLQFVDFNSYPPDGIIFSNTLTIPGGFSGTTNWVQVILGSARSKMDFLGTNHISTQTNGPPPYGDHPALYPFRLAEDSSTPADSPFSELTAGYLRVEVADNLQMWMLFEPPGGRMVPLRTVNWSWGGAATNNFSRWQLQVGTNSVNANFETEDYPLWKSKWDQGVWTPPL